MNYRHIILFAALAAAIPFAPLEAEDKISPDYTMEIEDQGRLEQFYRMNGPYEVKSQVLSKGREEYGGYTYTLWYPAGLGRYRSWPLPLVICLNGTGGSAENDEPLHEHLASWGFLVLGNSDPQTGPGWSGEYGIRQMLLLNGTKGSFLYGKVDTKHIGIIGYSQGGAGAWHALDRDHGSAYTAMATVSAVTKSISRRLKLDNWLYDTGKAKIPVLMVSGNGILDRDFISPLKEMNENFDAMTRAPYAAMGRRKHTDHLDIQRDADAYLTAFFCWQLKGDLRGQEIFTGPHAELKENRGWEQVRIKE